MDVAVTANLAAGTLKTKKMPSFLPQDQNSRSKQRRKENILTVMYRIFVSEHQARKKVDMEPQQQQQQQGDNCKQLSDRRNQDQFEKKKENLAKEIEALDKLANESPKDGYALRRTISRDSFSTFTTAAETPPEAKFIAISSYSSSQQTGDGKGNSIASDLPSEIICIPHGQLHRMTGIQNRKYCSIDTIRRDNCNGKVKKKKSKRTGTLPGRTEIHFIPRPNEWGPVCVRNRDPEMELLGRTKVRHHSISPIHISPPFRQPSMGGNELDYLHAPRRVDTTVTEKSIHEAHAISRIEI